MRIAKPKAVLFLIVTATAAATFAMLVTTVQSLVGQNPELRSKLSFPTDRQPAVVANKRSTVPVSRNPDEALAEIQGAAEKMFVSGVRKDFGAVTHGAQLIHRFPITNIYATPLAIAYLQASCRCVSATVAQHVLQPGESTTIDVRIDAGRFTGPNTETVRVKIVGDGFVSTCKLMVSADSKSDATGSSGQADPRADAGNQAG